MARRYRALHERKGLAAFTLVESLPILAVVGLVIAVAIPTMQSKQASLKSAQAVEDIARIDRLIERYRAANEMRLPAALSELGMHIPHDPWGQPYVYRPVEAGAVVTDLRKDRNGIPLNSDYDLYSLGSDGMTSASLQSPLALDDVVRAGNGGFIGPTREY